MATDYLMRLAEDIRRRCGGGDIALYRIYAVLALAKGIDVTREDVHDAWSAWMAADCNNPEHRSLVPYDQLAPHVQALDDPYVAAIRAAAEALDESWAARP